jgi:hypothetical protein
MLSDNNIEQILENIYNEFYKYTNYGINFVLNFNIRDEFTSTNLNTIKKTEIKYFIEKEGFTSRNVNSISLSILFENQEEVIIHFYKSSNIYCIEIEFMTDIICDNYVNNSRLINTLFKDSFYELKKTFKALNLNGRFDFIDNIKYF